MTKTKRKKTTVKRRSSIKRKRITIHRDQLMHRNDEIRKRLGAAKLPKQVTIGKLSDLETKLAEQDKLLLEDKRQDIKRRRKLFRAIERFEKILKEQLGRQISVKAHLSDFDDVHVLTYFKPKKGQHPFDGDPAVAAAFKKSKLNCYMDFVGTGTMISTMVRDNHFVEKKWKPKKAK